MRQKLQEKLDHLYQFNQTSSNNYSTAIQLATSIATGLAEVQSGKGFSALTGTFSVKELNMEWAVAIQKNSEDKVHAVQIEKEAVKNDWFLMDSKVVMETAKETANGVATITGIGAIGIGAAGGIINKVNLQSITDLLSTKSKEGYLYNEKSGPLYAKAIGGELKAGAIAGGSASYNTVKVGIEGSVGVNGRELKGEASLSMANAEVSARIDKNGFEIGAEASLAKYETGIDIPIPFTDHDLHIGGSASLGQVGGTVKVSSSGFKVNFPWGPGASPVGTGVAIEIK
ncbi:hypothetical protein [Bacillus cereus]|uniref:hypothetical protein n=1 Tax=Bacillus cereus TaxID=1396 RepID=UPI0039804068